MDFARILRLLGAGLVVLVLASCATGVALVGPRPFAHETSDLPVNPEILWGRLDNGVRYAVWPLPKQDKVSLRLLVEAGSLNETDQERGLAHFLEHMAFNGSDHLPPGTMVADLQKLGVGLSTNNNAATDFDHTLYKLDLPGASEELIKNGLFILRETAGGLTFPARQIEQERRVVLAEMRGRGSPGSRLWEAGGEMVFGDWLAKRWPIGSRDAIERVQRDDVVRFYGRWYRPQRLVVIAAGPVDGKAIERLIRTRFGDFHALDRASAPDPAFPPLAPRSTAIRLVPEPADNVAIALLSAEPLDGYRDDFAEREKAAMLQLATRILGHRLVDRSRAAGATFSVTRVASGVHFSRARIGWIELATTRAHWREAVAAAEQELRRALNYGFTEPEVSAVKADLRKDWQQALANEAGIKSSDAAAFLASNISSNLVVASLKPVVERLDQAIEPVGGAALQVALHAQWADGDRRWLLSGRVGGDISEAAVAAAVKASAAVALKPPEEKKETPFAYKSFGAPGAIVYHDKPRPNLTVAAFGNGAHAIILSSNGPYRHIHVGVDVMSGGRMAQPNGQDGLAYLANWSLLAGGLAAHSFSEVDRLLKRRKVDLTFAVTESQLQFTVTGPSEELPFALRVAAAYLAAPGFRDEGFALARDSLERVVAEISASPASVIENSLPRRRCAGDPRCGLPDLETLRTRRRDELKAWLSPALQGAPLIVTVVGHPDTEAVLNEIAETIGALPIRRAVPRERAPEIELPVLPAGAVETLTYTGGGDSAFAVVEFPMPLVRDHPHWIKLGLVARLLQPRLRDSLRVAAGESFGPTVMQLNGRPGWLRIQVDAASDRVGEIARRVMTLVREVETRPFTEEEMSRVVPVALREEDESRRQANTWLQALRGQPEPTAAFDRLNQTRGIIASTTLEEINALARELLKPQTGRTYLVVPAAIGPDAAYQFSR